MLCDQVTVTTPQVHLTDPEASSVSGGDDGPPGGDNENDGVNYRYGHAFPWLKL